MSNIATVRFAQISDPHLSDLHGLKRGSLFSKRVLGYLSWLKRRREEHSTEVLSALRHDLTPREIDQLLITGDLTHLGLPDEFRQVRDWLDGLEVRGISVVPGNHDSYVTEPWSATYSHWAPYMTSDNRPIPTSRKEAFPSLTVRGCVAFIGLSSALPTAPFFATGELGTEQLERLENLLEETAKSQLFRVIYLHHPPMPGMEKWRKRLRDSQQLSELVIQRGAELILHGHSHRWQLLEYPGDKRAIPIMGVASASAVGTHGEVASYNRYSVTESGQGWRLEVENRLYSSERQQFLVAQKHQLDIPR